ncbi:MAG: hypothetical protein IJ326_04645 [Lachnospiraceae bacterium]|nr:hypothetical protein [Lachnospiraceae bacterium]
MEFIKDGLLALLEILVNLSLQGSFCILLVLLARFLLRKAPRWCSYVLWSVVFLRLICPVFPEGSFSLMPRQLQIEGSMVLEQVQEEIAEHTVTGSILATEDVIAEKTVADVVGKSSYQSDTLRGSAQSDGKDVPINNENATTRPDNAYTGVLNALESPGKAVQRNQQAESGLGADVVTKLMMAVTIFWLLGTVAFATYHIVSYQLLKRRMRMAVETKDGVYEVQGEHLSFVMGIVNPKIYLSTGLDAETRKVIFCHERVHLQRKDYIFKPLALGICCVHWWNPLVWLSFYLMNKDCEMSCDEKVVALLGEESKTVYSYALLNEATRGDWFRSRRGSVCALLSFGEDNVKNRISHVLKYKKASIGVIFCAVLVLVVLGVGLCSNPKAEEANGDVADTASEEQAELLKEQEEALKAEQEALEKELEATKQKAEQEALKEELEKAEQEQQEIERLEQELAEDKTEFVETEEYGKMAFALEKYIALFIEDGAFGDSSPWVRDWTTLIHEGDTSTATIRFIMENSIPEYYVAEQTVRLTESDGDYYVYQTDSKMYSEINSVEDMEAAYEWTNGGAMKGIWYPTEYVRAILNHLVKGTNPEYYSAYQDPYTAAKVVLHLGADKAELGMKNYVKTVSPQDASVSAYGEGTVCNVYYYFADGSKAVIPMVLVEESMGIWMPMTNEDSSQKQYNVREVYDSYEVGDVTYQLTNMGIYQLDSNGLTFLYPAKTGVDAKLAYDNGNLYFPTDKSYYEGALDWADNSICVLNLKTLEVGYIDLPQAAWNMFPLAGLYVGDGYITLWKNDGFGNYVLPITDVFSIYNGKLATELNEKEKDAYGSMIREQVLENPNQVMRIGHHASTTTFAYVDMDGDGKSEEITMTRNGEGWYLPMDSFVLTAGEGREELNMECGSNEIYAYSPDGKRIFMMLYEDGPSGDPMTTFYRYEDNRLCEAGTIASDVRTAELENGIISTVIRRDVIQTDGIRVQYCINDNGEVKQIEQETYDFTALNDVELKEILKLYAEPDGSLDITIMMKPQTVHITKTDENFEWVLIEGENGTQGWLRVKDIIYVGDDETPSGEIFDGLSFAG